MIKPHGERTWVDTGAVLTYELKKDLVLKAEYHRVDGLALRRDRTPFGFVLTREDPSEEGYYGMVSAAWHF